MARSRRVGDPARELPAEPDPVRNRLFDLGGRTAVDPDMPGRSVKQRGAGVVFDQFVAADQASQRARGLEEAVMAGARLRSGYGVCLTLDDRADICIGPSPRQPHRPLRFGRRGRGQPAGQPGRQLSDRTVPSHRVGALLADRARRDDIASACRCFAAVSRFPGLLGGSWVQACWTATHTMTTPRQSRTVDDAAVAFVAVALTTTGLVTTPDGVPIVAPSPRQFTEPGFRHSPRSRLL